MSQPNNPRVTDPAFTLDERLARATWEAKPISRDRRNAEQGYDYASSDGIIGEARALLAEQGVSAAWALACHALDDALLLDSAKGAGTIQLQVSLWSPGGHRKDLLVWPIVIGQRRDGGALRPLDKAIKGAITTAMGEYFRGLLCLDRGVPDEEADARPDPVREARRDTAQRQQQRKPEPKPVAQSAPHEEPPPPSSPPGDLDPSRGAPDPSLDAGTERLARRARNITIGKLILAVGGRDAAGPIVGFAPDQIDELKLAPQDVQERAITALELALELGRSPQAPPAAEPPKGPPEGSPEYYAARAAMKGSQTHG